MPLAPLQPIQHALPTQDTQIDALEVQLHDDLDGAHAEDEMDDTPAVRKSKAKNG